MKGKMENPANIYEADGVKLTAEAERLRDFTWPTEVSLDVIGDIASGARFLDVGAGSNTSLAANLSSKGIEYVAFDRNKDFIKRQRAAGANAIEGDVRQMPFDDDSFDVCHARFVMAHLASDCPAAAQQILRATKPGGRAIFMDFDWTAASGSNTFNKIRDLLIDEMLFDADLGANLERTIQQSLAGSSSTLATKRYVHPRMYDYRQVLNLREASNVDLKLQKKLSELKRANELFDQLREESESASPPGFHFPDIVAVIATKSFER